MALFAAAFLIFILLQKIPVVAEIATVILIVSVISFVVNVGVEYNKIQQEKQIQLRR